MMVSLENALISRCPFIFTIAMFYTTTSSAPHNTIVLSIGINTVQKDYRWVRDPPNTTIALI
jgi:hypothetical protein